MLGRPFWRDGGHAANRRHALPPPARPRSMSQNSGRSAITACGFRALYRSGLSTGGDRQQYPRTRSRPLCEVQRPRSRTETRENAQQASHPRGRLQPLAGGWQPTTEGRERSPNTHRLCSQLPPSPAVRAAAGHGINGRLTHRCRDQMSRQGQFCSSRRSR